ncbi:MAG TPA: DEAD/DEAH box helicase [Polyangiaceae bacterium]|nr:DEAD/DEAH box helicase [Polyangiaceae bacterium]
MLQRLDPLADFSAPVRSWFKKSFAEPTRAQALGWGPIRDGKSTLLLAPTGSGKTLAAFLASLDRLMTEPPGEGVRVLYVSPLKALAVDVERNLRAPIAGIRAAAAELEQAVREPEVAMRSGDTPAKDRARFQRAGGDLLITTPESLYLLLTSQAARHFAALETVIIDEIHSLLPTKRGAHLFLSLERLEQLRVGRPPLQRIGLSATQRPLDEAARLLGGSHSSEADGSVTPRAVEVVDARMPPRLHVEVRAATRSSGEPGERGAEAPALNEKADPRSAWPEIHAPLLELIRSHRSTLVFVNSRRLAERLAQSLNELEGSEIALAHHGSLAKDRRAFIEDQLKAGALKALVATSSLELGIDMGAIDLVVQVEAPPSVASGLQRIGRAGHSVGEVSNGVVFPKHRGELAAAAVVTHGMQQGAVEATRYPRNPLDVLSQQIVALVSTTPMTADAIYALCRGAAPFADLPRGSFEGVLEMLAGRYPSDEFSELRPRITWDRVSGEISARGAARRIAIVSGGTIPDQGLYGVFLANSEKPVRVGELDEEMVFESRVGDIFLLGASSWHIDEITHDRVLVTPAPGQPGKMPFWKGGGPGRPVELGRKIGELTRELGQMPEARARALLATEHGFDAGATQALLDYLREQREATAVVPSDRSIIIERFKDELGDYRVCILSPFGRRVHAPWAMALNERFLSSAGAEVEAVWSDDGIVLRLPETEEQLSVEHFAPDPEEIEALVVQGLSKSSLFAAHFRENAGRALLLPKRDPRKRAPLWATRRRAADLLRVASQYPSFPILLETYRECLRDVFDLPALVELLSAYRRRELEFVPVESQRPSPFAATILFSYVGNFLYDGDAPLAERRAQALVLDQAELRELLGEAELRELFDADVIEGVERDVQRLREPAIRRADDIHDLLLLLGDLAEEDLLARAESGAAVPAFLRELSAARRIARAHIAGEPRYFAAEDAGKLRDALGVMPPSGLPSTFLERVPNALEEVMSRFARTHGPFTSDVPARRYGLGRSVVDAALGALERAGRVVHGEFLPGGREREWCDKNVLRQIKQRSLAKLRKAIEPAAPEAFARLVVGWQGAVEPSRATDALDRAIDQLQGAPIAATVLLQEVLPARVRGFMPSELDSLLSTGELTWLGVEPHGANDGKIALFRTEKLALLAPVARPCPGELQAKVRAELAQGGALFFVDLLRRVGGFPRDLLNAIWDLVWAGEVTNDTLAPLRSLRVEQKRPRGRPEPRARRPVLPGSEGRWSLVRRDTAPSVAEQRTARALLLLDRYGVVSREVVNADGLGNFAELYPVFKAMEEAGKLRRGYFISGLGGAQFARPGADERLRQKPEPKARAVVLAATDPANPYGAALPWPEAEPRPQRTPGAAVVLFQGRLLAYLAKSERALSTFLEVEEPAHGQQLAALLTALQSLIGPQKRRGVLLGTIDRVEAQRSPLAAAFIAAGFAPGAAGLSLRRMAGAPDLDAELDSEALEDAGG